MFFLNDGMLQLQICLVMEINIPATLFMHGIICWLLHRLDCLFLGFGVNDKIL